MAITHGGDIFAVARRNGWAWQDVLDFSANINPMGPSPKVKAAICNALGRIVHYPEREPQRLRQMLSGQWNVGDNQIILGNGATELIFFVSRFFSDQQTTLAVPVFSEFHRAFPQSRMVNLNNSQSWPLDGLLVLTRPANPTGALLPLELLERHLQLSKGAVLVDESFLEFSGNLSAAVLIREYPSLLILRSLTKFYALPGLRVGALLGDADLLELWKERREPWQVNVLAEEAAIAAVTDVQHAAQSVAIVEKEKHWLTEQLRTLPGLQPHDSTANFIFIELSYAAAELSAHFLNRKILVRDCAQWPGVSGEAVRIAVRTRSENERLIEIWREFRP